VSRERGPVAVVDIGSNSGRVVVYAVDAERRLRILATTRAPLRLVESVDDASELGAAAVSRLIEALSDFRAVAVGAGARRTVAIATAAMRDAANGPELIARIRRELGIEVQLIDGATEARYGFLGAIHSLPVDRGLLFDMGGGSLQLSQFLRRRPGQSWSLPLGSLRLTHRFLLSDPPTPSELRRLREHAQEVLSGARIPRLLEEDTLVGTGGTLRNLAKIDARARAYPIERVHGYTLARKRIRDLGRMLSERRVRRRESVPGLSDARADSVVGGAVAIEALMEEAGTSRVVVSGDGVREGLAYSLLAPGLPPAAEVREESVASLTARFADWNPETAARRREASSVLQRTLDRGTPPDVREALLHSARLLDIGRSIDFFDRYHHVAGMVVATDLNGFSHRDMALMSAVLRVAGGETGAWKTLSPLLKEKDRTAVIRAGVILSLADEIVERCRPGVPLRLSVRVREREVVIAAPAVVAWRPRRIAERFQQTFGRQLIVRPG
jgi:exopolyphosphatase/guanosine-5'-triphosphate,3'-diphosphate pyrophosphatase